MPLTSKLFPHRAANAQRLVIILAGEMAALFKGGYELFLVSIPVLKVKVGYCARIRLFAIRHDLSNISSIRDVVTHVGPYAAIPQVYKRIPRHCLFAQAKQPMATLTGALFVSFRFRFLWNSATTTTLFSVMYDGDTSLTLHMVADLSP